MSARAALALSASLLGCLEYSPHALPTGDSERGLNAKAIERILAAPVTGPLRFAVVGDTQRSFDETQRAIASINSRDDVQFVVQVGDFTNVGLLLEFQWMNDVFARLRVPYLVVIGNHDHFSNGEAIYEEMFGPKDFAFTHRRVRFVFYDSNSVSHDFDGTVPDLAWVEAALAPSPDHDRSLAFAHIAPGGGSLFDEALTKPMLDVLAGAAVGMSIHGHAHRFETFERDGVPILVADSVDHRSYLVVFETPDGGFAFEKVDF
jgi:3',5'-cyclic AMP phosphodiesterase CpdA